MNVEVSKLSQDNIELPGWAAQKLMAPGQNPLYRQVPETHYKAGVMALLYPEIDSQYHIIIIERAKHNVNDKHAGQLSFPGGKYEAEDGDMVTCALREVDEEIGVPASAIEVVRPLSELYVFASNFNVFPYLGILEQKPSFTPQLSEVHNILTVPIADILNSNNKAVKDITLRDVTIPEVPYYDLNGKVLWGATAMIMSEVEWLLRHS